MKYISRWTPGDLIANIDGSPSLSARRRCSIPKERRELSHNQKKNASKTSVVIFLRINNKIKSMIR